MRLTARPASFLRGARAGAAGRVLRPPAQGTLSLVRRKAQPATVMIARLTVTAVLAFVVARLVTGAESPILAPLSALLVVQATLYQTFRSALQRVASVIAGVLVALGLSSALGFTWWSLGVAIAAALAVGYALRLGDSILEVPISAMLILSLPVEGAALERILSTLIGAATGLVSNLVLAPLRLQPAEEAIDDLSRRLADLLDQMSADLAEGSGSERTGDWVRRARVLTDELEQVERALGQAEESVRLNPRGSVVIDPRVYLRRRLEVLEHATLTIRGIARSLNDSAGLSDEVNPVRDPHAATRVADELRELAAALRAYGQLARSKSVDRGALKADVDRHLASATEHHGEVADILRADPATPSPGWPLRGELVTHLDRLRSELHPAPPRQDGGVRTAQPEAWRHPIRAIVGKWRHRRGGQSS
jgi:uncharacterized membrane protein YgaE (UPF0421/DUF939 family)